MGDGTGSWQAIEVDLSTTSGKITFDENGMCSTMYVLFNAPYESSYCGDSTCGAALLAQGWQVLGEWGTSSRFGGTPIGNSAADFVAAGWRTQNETLNAPKHFITSGEASYDGAVTWYISS